MTIEDPKNLHAAWADRFNAQDVDGMMDLWERDAVFVPQPGVPTNGDDSRKAVEGFVGLGLPISLSVRRLYVSGDLALGIADWTLKGTAADGNQVDLSGTTADILRRGDDGWKFALDNPFGTA